MNRLTKQIGLVLISSSLVLLGCSEPEDPELAENPNSQNPYSDASNSTWNSSGSSYHGGYSGSPGGYRPGLSMAPAGGPGFRSGGSSFSSYSGGSIRGGFGASAHGAGS